MKYKILLLLVLTKLGNLYAQSPIDQTPNYKKNPALPTFKILQTDSTWLSNKDLGNYKYTAIIYFSPDCNHCQLEAKDMVDHIDSLKQVLFLWVSYRDFNDIKAFSKKYKFDQYPNIKIGRDPEYAIPAFFQVKFTPFVALYNEKKQFVKAWETGVEMPELIEFIYKK